MVFYMLELEFSPLTWVCQYLNKGMFLRNHFRVRLYLNNWIPDMVGRLLETEADGYAFVSV
jgi:hypothetical protein